MKELIQKRKAKICKAFCDQHKTWLEVDFEKLVAGEYGEIVRFKDQNELRVEIPANESIDGRAFFFWFTPPVEKNQGRPAVSDELERRVDISVRLPLWVKIELLKRGDTMTSMIETAVVAHYKIEKGDKLEKL